MTTKDQGFGEGCMGRGINV